MPIWREGWVGLGRKVQPTEGGGPWTWLMRAVSPGNEASLSGVGNEVCVVIKKRVSMVMQRAVCTENLLGVGGAKVRVEFQRKQSPPSHYKPSAFSTVAFYL